MVYWPDTSGIDRTVRIRCHTWVADHDLAMSRPLAASGRGVGCQGPTVESVPLGYRIGPWNFGYELKTFYPSDQRVCGADVVV